jgi:hypothetical protein
MTEEELNLLQFTSIYMAELCTCPPKVMRREVLKLQPLGAVPNHIPNDVFGNACSP